MGKDVNQINSYRAQIRKLKEKRENFVKQYIKLAEELKDINKRLSALNKKVDNYNKSDFFLSEHFIQRFRERVRNISVPEMKREIFTKRSLEIFKTLDDGMYPIILFSEEYFVILKSKILVTILNGQDKERDTN